MVRLSIAIGASLAVLIAACGGSTAATSQASSSAPASTTASSSSSAPATSSTAGPGQAGFALGTAAVKVGMMSDPNNQDIQRFVPSAVTVHVGDIVEWNYDPAAFIPHNIVFSEADSLSNHKGLGAKADASGSPGDGVWQVRFTLAGRYNYVCTFHAGMTGTVTVS